MKSQFTRKNICKLLTFIMLPTLVISFMLSGCSNGLKFISDGDFKYYYMKEYDSYAVVGTTEQGKKEDILYFPAYYKEKLVTSMGYFERGAIGFGSGTTYWITPDDITATKIYFPYTVDDYFTESLFGKDETAEGQIYFANSNKFYLKHAVEMSGGYGVKYYVTPSAYEYIITNIKDYGDINRANTSYLFNYDDAPNEGYFFINNFTAGGLIEDTPYEPKREGYAFGGWYKEPECENLWNFEKDTLPGTVLREDGEQIYQETKLYANWIKK